MGGDLRLDERDLSAADTDPLDERMDLWLEEPHCDSIARDGHASAAIRRPWKSSAARRVGSVS